MQILEEFIIETQHKKEYILEYFKELLDQNNEIEVELNTLYTRKIVFCEGYIEKRKFIEGTYKIDKNTQISIHCGNTREFIDIFFDMKIKYEIFDHIFKSEKKETRKFLNRTILIHGPPGTGKTTLCKAVCKKVTVRDPIKTIHYLDCSSFISKYYGESMKLVHDFFKSLNKECLVIADEIESLISNRKSFTNDPLDSLRIVNAFLVQIDNSKSFFFFTTNLLENLDSAFVDRMDIVIQMPIINDLKLKAEIIKKFLLELMIDNLIDYEYILMQELQRIAFLSKDISIRCIKKKIINALNSRNVHEVIKELENKLQQRNEISRV